MDEARFHSGHFKNEAFRWKPVFTRRQTRLYASENTRLVLDQPPPVPPASTQEIVETFVDNKCIEDAGRYLSRKLLLGNFLYVSDIELFRGQPDPFIFRRRMVLLDDRNDGNVTRTQLSGDCRPFRGPLTAYQLYSELLQQRLSIPDPRAPRPTAQPNITEAERRLIYITDLDSHCSLALAATTSRLQAAFLRDFLHRYLTCRAAIGVQIHSPSPIGASTYSLEFHLPYYAWRQMPSIIEDERLKGNGNTRLRVSEEVIHLEMQTPTPPDPPDPPSSAELKDYIYEAQLSVMIAGADNWVWTAYCFVDVYFKGERHSEDVNYLSQPDPRWTGRLDPHSGGRHPADPPIWMPREYFLRALAARMEQVKEEWSNSVSRLVQGIEPQVTLFTRKDTNIGGASDLNMTRRKGFKWTIRVLHQFTNLLSKTIDAWETFKDGEIRYFYIPQTDDSNEVSWGTYLASIDKDVTELKDLRSSLQCQTDLFENMTTNLVTHAQHAEAIITREQSKFIQALTVITIFYLPPTLAATIFSMQSILPSDVKFKDWIYTLLALFGSTALLVMNLSNLTHLAQWAAHGLRDLWTWIRRRWRRWWRGKRASRDDEHEMDEQDDGLGGNGARTV